MDERLSWPGCRAGLTIVPFMPYGIGPPVVRGPPRPSANFFLSQRFIITGVCEYEDRRRIGLFYQIALVLESTGHCYIRGPLQGHKIGCPRLQHLLNFTLRYGYSLWYDVIFVDNILYDNINVLDLALWAEKILKLNVFLCNVKNAYTVVN